VTSNKQAISKSGKPSVQKKLPDQTTVQIISENTIPSSNNQLATPRQERTSHQSSPRYFLNFIILYSFLN